MGTLVLRLLVSLCFLQCVCWGVEVTQEKLLLTVGHGEAVVFPCRHNDQSFFTMYWYQQKKEKGLKLLAYSVGKDSSQIEDEDNPKKWILKRPEVLESSLEIINSEVEDSAVYFCAAGDLGQEKQYFGEGTILFVLEPGKKILYPKVKIYLPNKQEFRSEQKLISLVCVANGFYPEHVRLEWFVNGILKTSTYENIPQESDDKQTFYTSKRLSLTRLEYFNPGNTFKCVAGFIGDYSGNKTSDEIQGEADCSISKEEYGMYIYQGKISYIMVLCKSAMYGIIVLFIIWRRKAIATSS